MENKVDYLEDLIQDKKQQIAFNIEEAKKSNTPLFYANWNRNLEYEIQAFEMLVAKEKGLTLKTA